MLHLAAIAVRKPTVAICLWLLAVGVLGLVGSGLPDATSPTILAVPGTDSSRAQDVAQSRFGDSTLVPILLEGPAMELNRQGPGLVHALRARRDARVLSPWDDSPGADQLRPQPTAATVLVAVERSRADVVAKVQDQIVRLAERETSKPVVTRVTGQAALDQALADEALSAARQAELIAIPALLLLLILAFRAPVPALVCTALAASTLPAAYGGLTIAAHLIEIDAVAAAFGSMIGLALTAAFAALIVTRFREEIEPDADVRAAAVAATGASATAGRTILLAGTAMAASMVVATLTSPTTVLLSVGTGATLATIIGAIVAVGAGSAILALLGPRIDKLALSKGRTAPDGHVPLLERAGPVTRHPIFVGAVALVLLLVLSGPVLSFNTGEPDVATLPEDSQARKDFERFQEVMGPGATSPFELVVVNRRGAITTREMLVRMQRLQRRLAKDPRVASVVGPGAIAAQSKDLQGVPRGLKTAADTVVQSDKDLTKLLDGLGQAGDGVKTVRLGLAEAADGASQLNDGSGKAEDGAKQLSDGLGAAAVGSTQLATGIGTASSGADQLADGAATANGGAKQLADGLTTADTTVANGLPLLQSIAAGARANADAFPAIMATSQRTSASIDSAQTALDALSAEAKADPNYSTARDALVTADAAAGELNGQLTKAQADATGTAGGVEAAVGQVGELSNGLGQLKAGAVQLSGGLDQLAAGNADLASGLKQLSSGGSALHDGLGQLSAGSQELAGGLGQLHDGTGQLASGLGNGYGKSAPLEDGMGEITSAVQTTKDELPFDAVKDYKRLRMSSPGLFDSGYYTLAAVDGAPQADLDAATFVVNVDRGGLAGRITVTPKYPASDARTKDLRADLEDAISGFGHATHTQTAVGGTGAQLQDFDEAGSTRLPLVIVALLLTGFVVLVAVTRGLLIAAVAVALNLLVLASTFGVLVFLFGNDHPLAGPGYLDPISAIGIATVVLGLSLDYEVFVLARVRERYETVDLQAATRYGLRSTRSVLTASAVVIVVIAAAYARTDLATVREFAIGVAVAVFIDATVVRLILLPLALRRLGKRGWTTPDWTHRRPPAPPAPLPPTPRTQP